MLELIWGWILSGMFLMLFTAMIVMGYWIWKVRKLQKAIPKELIEFIEKSKRVVKSFEDSGKVMEEEVLEEVIIPNEQKIPQLDPDCLDVDSD